MSFHKRLLSGSAFAALALSATTAFAQDVGAPVDEVIVTGSRIPVDPNLNLATPVQSLDSDAIRLSGEINLADVVNDIPALVSSLTAENSTTGANSLNLRGLGGARTLTLVNGRRHVSGFRGTQAVDIGSIPQALVERVEVITGGASAIYGADAVTGVVNFVLKEDFEGYELNARGGISGEGDAENFSISGLYGTNFGENDRGNIVVSVDYQNDSNITLGDRDWSRGNGISTTAPNTNPLLRFQPGELNANTPNFNNLFGFYGGLIPAADAGVLDGLTLTSAEQALIARAGSAAPRALIDNPTFWLTSQAGSVSPGSFSGASRRATYVDLNNNGIADCQESRAGRTSFLAGCWIIGEDGQARVFEDGQIVSGGLWGSGGDGGAIEFDRDTIFPETDRYAINLNTTYELAPGLELFFEGKYVNSVSETFNDQDTFYDTLFITPDNPFIPSNLQPVADQVGGLLLTADPVGFNDDNPLEYERETTRLVGGMRWETESGHNFEVSANHGRFKRTDDFEALLIDRQFAAIDAVEGPNGEIVCRSDLDPNARYEIDYFTGGNGFVPDYYTFTPGDGQCQPLNPFGLRNVSQAAQDFVNVPVTDTFEMTQTVLSGILTGSFDVLNNHLDGDVGYATGIEYRRETSESTPNDFTLGILPEGTPFTPGQTLSEVTNGAVTQIDGIDNTQQFTTSGSFDVKEVFGEVRVPFLLDRPGAQEISFDAAARYAEYSTLGSATTWKLGAVYAPMRDLSFRGTVSKAVRAPNISELFDPRLPITVSATADPCDPGNVPTGGPNVEANCIAALRDAGVPNSDLLDADGRLIWQNPLTGRFTGVSGGNPNLVEETADTFTLGAIIQPRFIDRLSITVDYWDIEIDQAVGAVSADVILTTCYQSNNFPNVPACNQFTRRTDGGLDSLESGSINFARLEASGIDLATSYSFDWGQDEFGINLVGSYQEKLDRFFDPDDLDAANPELREIQLPEYSGNVGVNWTRDRSTFGMQMSYQSKQSYDEIEDIEFYAPFGFTDDTFIFDANGSYEVSENLSIYGGVNNITDEEPFANQTAWPVGPRGRFFFLGATLRG